MRFRQWRQGRPFWGALLTVLAGVELFLSGRFDLSVGGVVLQLGFAGMQTTIIPIVVVLAGALAMAQPVHHVFYGVIALVLSVYSLVAVNGGGLGVGMALGVVGSIVVVSWMAPVAASEPPTDTEPVHAQPVADAPEDPVLLFDDGPRHDPQGMRSAAAVLAVALVAGGLTGAAPAAPGSGLCLFGFILCRSTDQDPTAGSSQAPSPTPDASGQPAPSSSEPGDGGALGGVVDGLGDAVDDLGDAVGGLLGGASDGGASDDAASDDAASDDVTSDDAASPDAAAEPPSVTVEVPPSAPLPPEEGLPLVLGGNEDPDVFAIPADLKASDLRISGLRTIALVSVPVGAGSGERRAAIKLVADHVEVVGFSLTTYTDGGAAGTRTTASSVTMDGSATMYLTSVSASGPDGEAIRLLADDPPQSVTALLLALTDPTIGLLGATSDRQVWSGFQESVWAG
ncbi:DUF6114 domain-containing protein [Xylanimonas ulmi]|uniref:DUF6114 domain-containing protein n=1 Tax=Xylanimonas ulmi TaxID=228973 RepID=UPI00102BCDD5|nr:DUF6114 domain-containing protein [Xylanibacterium ulmi]